ncbi:uncharacterized protein LOC8043350 [Ixodes scapularis]|uniref:uncharacterized protein LOC8043350 n=1 Tax=Ixodes scapularis TaxID=6945 RepID=UPI001C3955C8|nr:uncharacterized protein LOC8043350 [Ixodes scapularis]
MATSLLLGLSALCIFVQAARAGEPNATVKAKPEPGPVVPCLAIPMSGWRSTEGTTHLLSSTTLWSLPHGSRTWKHTTVPETLNSSWRVVCSNPFYVVLSNGSHALVHTLEGFKWYNVTSSHHKNSTQGSFLIWCTNDEVHSISLKTGTILRFLKDGQLNASNASKLPVMPTKKSHTHTWYQGDHVYIVTDKYHNGTTLKNDTVLWKASRSSSYQNWTSVLRWSQGSPGYPSSLSKSYAWADNSTLWLWRELNFESQLWAFNITSGVWLNNKVHHSNTPGHPILAWTELSSIPCLLFSQLNCSSSNFSAAAAHCVKLVTASKAETSSTIRPPTTSIPPKTKTPTTATRVPHANATSRTATSPLAITTTVTTPTRITTGQTTSAILSSPSNQALPTASSISKDEINDSAFPGMDPGHAKWHQRNSGIFGSIIFFGTSITIFTIVGVVWCIRHCVHFPKEALLLRDPPSVRYTAIPDTIA